MRPKSGGLADRLYATTRSLHAQAERSGVVRDILRGRATRQGYSTLLRNLLPAYEEMEHRLDGHRDTPGVRMIVQPAVFRTRALESDLKALCGEGWGSSLPLLPAGERYQQQVVAAAHGTGARLIAHAYTRYLGDLNGGQFLRRLLAQSLALGPDMLSFYDFPAIEDPEEFKLQYRTALDRAGSELGVVDDVLDEAMVAFALNIELSNAVQAAL